MDRDETFKFFERAFAMAEKIMAFDIQPHDFGVGELLTRTEIHLVAAVAQNEGVSVTGLAGEKGVTKGAISQMLTRLEQKGLIEKRPDPENLSRLGVFLTPKGRLADESHERVHENIYNAFQEVVGDMDDASLAVVQRFFEKMDAFMDALPGKR